MTQHSSRKKHSTLLKSRIRNYDLDVDTHDTHDMTRSISVSRLPSSAPPEPKLHLNLHAGSFKKKT